MGPLAAAFFAGRVVQLTPAEADQEHIPVLLHNDPRIPDRSSALVGGGDDPLPAMLRGLTALNAGGAQCIAVPCNTAHLWFDALQAGSAAPLLHIVDAVVDDLRRQGLQSGRVGIMGTPATLRMGLYQRCLAEAGFEPLVPTDEEVRRYCVTSIAAVKGNRMEEAFAPAARGIHALQRRGAQAVVLGCTELPLAVPAGRRREAFGELVITDSIDALARSAVAACHG